MADEQTMRDHIEDLMEEIIRLRWLLDDRNEQIRALKKERDSWTKTTDNA